LIRLATTNTIDWHRFHLQKQFVLSECAEFDFRSSFSEFSLCVARVMNSDVFGPTGELRITKMDALHPSPHVALVFALLLVAELISKFIIKLKPLNVRLI
jgi:hypothetical protein